MTGSPFDEEDCDDCTTSPAVAAYPRTSARRARPSPCGRCDDDDRLALVDPLVRRRGFAGIRRDSAGQELESPAVTCALAMAGGRKLVNMVIPQGAKARMPRTFVLPQQLNSVR
jgi:hypothetical protein